MARGCARFHGWFTHAQRGDGTFPSPHAYVLKYVDGELPTSASGTKWRGRWEKCRSPGATRRYYQTGQQDVRKGSILDLEEDLKYCHDLARLLDPLHCHFNDSTILPDSSEFKLISRHSPLSIWDHNYKTYFAWFIFLEMQKNREEVIGFCSFGCCLAATN